MSTDIASAKAGAAASAFPAAMTFRGPGVIPQAPVIGRASCVVRTGVGATSIATPGYATSPVLAEVWPAAKGPAVPGGNATVTPNPIVAPASAPATAVGAVPTSYGPAFGVASVVVFLGALYAYFDQEATPTATSANTWLVYLLLHLEIVLMVLSLGVFIVASIGFIGALRENIELLDLYNTLQGSFVTTEAVFIVMLFFLPTIGREFVISHITTEFIVHYRDKLDYQREIDYVQSSLHCCGMTDNSYRDWNANPYFNCSPTNPSAERCSVPPSCCRIMEVPDIVNYDSGTGAHEAEPIKASKSGAPESAGASANDGVYVTTLCGRGVMNLKEQDAWKVRTLEPASIPFVYLRGLKLPSSIAGPGHESVLLQRP
ncbi:hypothetical protein MRX96_008027 [Rhipicephalus microplus]